MKIIPFLILSLTISGCSALKKTMKTPVNFDWQGHRGARGLYPENSIEGFLNTLTFPVKTLELDCVVSKDEIVIVSHEPWFSADFCSHPDGRPVLAEEEKDLILYQMNYGKIKRFDTGKRGHPHFTDQQSMATFKPTLKGVLEEVEAFCSKNGRPLPYFNIEMKSRPEWDDDKTPHPGRFAQLIYEVIQSYQEKICIQSFDVRSLQAINKIDPAITLALLVENREGLKKNVERLGFTPAIYSPNHLLVTPELVNNTHAQNIKIIPWTVNQVDRMNELIKMGVDGIITDYPNLISHQ